MQANPLDTSLPDSEEQRAQRALLAKLRHDLRTPINAILGYCELLIEDAPARGDERLLPDLQKIYIAGKALLAQVNEILTNDRVASGALDVDIETVAAQLQYQLRTPIDAVLGYCELLLEETNERGETEVVADLEKIRTAADNFVVAINVIVNFMLIGEARVDFDEKAAAAGTMVEQAVKSIRALDANEPTADEHGTILIVDDNPINRDILMHRLTRQGHIVHAAENGRAALDLVNANKFDLILLDILMPIMNGFEVLQTLKADPATRDIPVIMISALDELDSVVHCIELGAEDYLPKPFNPVLLNARIDSSLEKKRLRDQQRELFGKFATKEVVEELMARGFALGGKYVNATAMFSDIRSFTT